MIIIKHSIDVTVQQIERKMAGVTQTQAARIGEFASDLAILNQASSNFIKVLSNLSDYTEQNIMYIYCIYNIQYIPVIYNIHNIIFSNLDPKSDHLDVVNMETVSKQENDVKNEYVTLLLVILRE